MSLSHWVPGGEPGTAPQPSPLCSPLQLLGQWFYIAGASRYPPHLAELRAVTFEAFSFSPGSHEDELNITEIIRIGPHWDEGQGWKVMRLSMGWILTTGEISLSPSLAVDDNGVASTARVIQSDKDLLILNHINIDSPNLSLSARTPNVSKEHLEEFKAHLRCLGFTEQEVFHASTEVPTPPGWVSPRPGSVPSWDGALGHFVSLIPHSTTSLLGIPTAPKPPAQAFLGAWGEPQELRSLPGADLSSPRSSSLLSPWS
uniref:Apolipoprotein M n=1 Tax=Zonotrichia albicollis TaxID=44394 RepID=A0A8D2Q9U6_ZONAL